MSKKLLPNRISKVVAPDALTKVRQAVQLLNEALGDDTPISDDHYKSLRVIADKLKRVCDDVYEIAKENTDSIQKPMSLEEITKDKLFYEHCDSIRALLKSFNLSLEREQNIAGAEYYNACIVYESDIDDKIAKDNTDTKALNIKSQLNGVERNRGGNKADKTAKADDK
jgi:hypothetical protein